MTSFDLRTAWLTTLAPAANTAGTEDGGTDDGDVTPTAAAIDATHEPTEEELRNPRIKQLSAEAAKHRNNAKAEKDRADAAEARFRQLSLKVAFDAALRKHGITDAKAAWKLAQYELNDVDVDEEGNADELSVATIIKKVASEYPSLVTTEQEPTDRDVLEDKYPALVESGRSLNKRRGSGTANNELLKKKYPALSRLR